MVKILNTLCSSNANLSDNFFTLQNFTLNFVREHDSFIEPVYTETRRPEPSSGRRVFLYLIL